MQLIISEKAIAGKRIAEILAGKPVSTKLDGGAQYFPFDWNGKPCMVIPLSGHISEVDFPKQYNQWQKTPLKELALAPVEYTPSQRGIIGLLQRAAPNADAV